MIDKELLNKLKGILDWWKIGDFADRKKIERELTSLLNEAYDKGRCDGMEVVNSYYYEEGRA